MNFASGVLSVAPGAAGTTLTSGNMAFLPTIVAPHTMRIALDPDGIAGVPEIVTVTAHGAAALTVTVLRGQESSFGAGPARAHAVDTIWRHVLTRASIIEMTVPAASGLWTVAATPDPGYVFVDGSTLVNAQVMYPAAWARIPAAWKAAPDIVLPDWRGRFLVMDDASTVFVLGAAAGSNTHAITQSELPAATISIDPPNTVVSIDPPNTAVTGSTDVENVPHTHPGRVLPTAVLAVKSTNPADWMVTAWDSSSSPTGPESVPHTHPAGTLAVDIPAFNVNVDQAPFASGPLGSGAAMSLVPAHGVVNYQLKVH